MGKGQEEKTIMSAQEMQAKEAELRAREEALERDLKSLNIIRSHLKEFEATSVAQGKTLTLAEVGKAQSIEMVTEREFAAEQELFMNELVTINVYTDATQGALEVITLTVNGINQPVIRGLDQTVKRKYVECLARSRVTSYKQITRNANEPDKIEMLPMSGLTYPFSLREDRNPKGPAWLQAILQQPM
jgi:hypothetical protein